MHFISLFSSLLPVLRYAEEAKKYSHTEITNLVIPNLNSSHEHIDKLSSWIAKNLGKDTPLHLSAYFPKYRMTINSTPVEMLEELRIIALKNLDFVYCGNIRTKEGSSTFCPKCSKPIITRDTGIKSYIKSNGECPFCGHKTGIISGE